MSEAPHATGKSIFAHKQTYSQKGNSKSLSIKSIVEELERLEGAFPHVPDPKPPNILEGMRPRDITKLVEERVEEQNCVLRKERKERPDLKSDLRSIRIDTHVLVAGVYSYPDAVEDMDMAEYLAWRDDVIAFARRDAETNALEIMTIAEHLDEAHPHIHVLALPLVTQSNPRMNAKLCHEGHVAQDRHIKNGWSGSPSRAYKQSMSAWQDRYHAEVGSRHGQARTGPKRRRLDRATWKAEQGRIQLLKDSAKADRRAEASTNRAEEAEMRERAAAKRTAAHRLQEAELGQRLAEEGLIAALAAEDADDRLLSRLSRQTNPRGYPSRTGEENGEIHATVGPIIDEGLEALRAPSPAGSTLERFKDVLAVIGDWTKRLAAAIPRWMRWEELVDRIARTAQQTFGWASRPDTLAGVVEATPAWRDIEESARKDLNRARGVAALVAQERTAEPTQSRSVFRFDAD